MIRSLFVILCTLLSWGVAFVHAQNAYEVSYDLHYIIRDKLYINIDVPESIRKSFTEPNSTATFVFPVIAPGTYEYSPWWKLVSDFTALDTDGNPLPVGCSIDSQFVIIGAEKLKSISYWIEDSFDVSDGSVQIFHPAGIGFEDSIAVINHSGLIGYVDGFQKLPFNVRVQRPKNMYCATALDVTERTDSTDTYTAPSYDALVDGPVLYSRPDTASFEVNGTRILVAMAHHSAANVAPAYAKSLRKVTESIASFLGTMPVKQYAFLFYLWNGDTTTVRYMHFAIGALEHNLSSMYFWRFSKTPFGLSDIAAHEFLHILVPLNLHSKEIDAFSFRVPHMSEHIWLYEGVTEYFAEQSLLRGKLLPEKSFVEKVRGWIRSADELPSDFNLTDFSKNVLKKENQALFSHIYEYGPLNALLLDITLRKSSDSSTGLLELIQRLMKDYGPSRPFDDDSLFSEIGRVSTKEAEKYCTENINSTRRIPFKSVLQEIGLTYTDSLQTSKWSFGIIDDESAKDDVIMIKPETNAADQRNPLGVMDGDILLSLNNKTVSPDSYDDINLDLFTPFNDDEITIVVQRKDAQVTLTGKPFKTVTTKHHLLEVDPKATSKQVALRNAVFYGK